MISRETDRVVRLRVIGRLDRAAHAELRRSLRRAFDRARNSRVVVDLTEVDAIGSECIEVLLVGYTRALRGGHGFEVSGATGGVRQALEVTGLCERSALYLPAVDDSLDALLASTAHDHQR
ncbi:STAS domain-containing protein [Actinoplanes sp. NPDC051861]|uniref:STAS domain-containing protein n=1 Tax=Actinoplanes sp. NPDC051861 TaxID=3155170 RepID=UPI00343B68B0